MPAARNAWCYRPGRTETLVEYASWAGDIAPVLGGHFHDEEQLTFVVSGSRQFLIGSRVFLVEAGHGILIPAGVPHRSLPHAHAGTRCLNFYGRPLRAGRSLQIMFVPGLADHADGADPAALLSLTATMMDRDTQFREPLPMAPPVGWEECSDTIGALASRQRQSRESFSRRFVQCFGMPPHAFRIVSRLNEGRRRIRAGASIARTAAELGFADQSHFGRHFRRVFGMTPRAYREAMR